MSMHIHVLIPLRTFIEYLWYVPGIVLFIKGEKTWSPTSMRFSLSGNYTNKLKGVVKCFCEGEGTWKPDEERKYFTKQLKRL